MSNSQTQPVVLYVDGACRGNPGLGGWGVYMQYPDGQEQELCGGEPNTTNNRMELTAAIEGIKACAAGQPLVIWTDSNYVKQGITEWIIGWKKKNWRKADGKAVINADLWQQLDQTCQNRTIEWHWIKGHAGHAGNERADMLANRGADQVKNGTGNHQVYQNPVSAHSTSTTPETDPAAPEPDWLSHDPLGLDMVYEQEPDDLYTADEEWVDDVEPKTAVEQHNKEQQLEQANPQNGIQRTPATLKLSGRRQLILDTETTGFSFADGDRVIEVGVIEMINRKLTGSSFHVYINPLRPVGDSVTVHGITDEFLQDKLRFEQIAHELSDYLHGAEIIAHNATFDMNFLEGEFLKAGLPSLKSRVDVTDTLALAKRKHPGQKNSLDALVRRYEIKQRDRTFHGALLDAEILADVYLTMTGGQVTLDIGDDQNSAGGLTQHRQFAGRFSLPVIAASQQEAQHHVQWLDQFGEKNGTPALWRTVFE
ncbi:DNA polymerase III subunit epsilon [Alkanindiges hydrocarboniclasticus]|uniref:Ribonuclease H n=1 Tax=Alkanindiges hydrocarboniclasticus TaxID=1907941 RepID=A0A1S8CVF8_9GAMM|nr:DNA polymerase III subunit epsilon [Alkanindiges hydrocarboniclasticus]ONG39634.1 DNA polymerase III subunit epsilon [Alkanindiges hydrocarboniclasticus]